MPELVSVIKMVLPIVITSREMIVKFCIIIPFTVKNEGSLVRSGDFLC